MSNTYEEIENAFIVEELEKLNWSRKRPVPPDLRLKQFDIDFDKEKEVLFHMLNDVEPIFMQDTNFQSKLDDNPYVDPRTNLDATEAVIDHTKPKLDIKFFTQFLSKSRLSKIEQGKCSIYFFLKKNNEPIPDQIQQVFDKTKHRRKNDQDNFLKFLKRYCEAHFQIIYCPVKFLQKFHLVLFKETRQTLLQHDNIMYQVITAFPMPNKFSETHLTLENVKVISQSGQIPLFEDLNLHVLKTKFETYLNLYLEKIMNPNETQHILKVCENHSVDFFLPSDSLLFLLTVPEETDTDSYMPFEIHDYNGRKIIIFEKPTPSRNASLETNSHVFQKTFESFVAASNFLTFLQIDPSSLVEIVPKIKEISATDSRGTYKMQSFDEFVQKYPNDPNGKEFKLKTNEFLVKSTLGEGDNCLTMLTSCQTNFCKDKESMSFINSSIKLEYKKQFGCEILTMYELLNEWIKQKLIPNSQTNRHRIDAHSFRTIENYETVTLEQIEKEILKNHQVDLSKILGALHNFLLLVRGLPTKKYLLRHSSNHSGKIMVYNETHQETGTGCISLHSIATENAEKVVTFKAPFIPIDETVYTDMHHTNAIVPCSFPPWVPKKKFVNDRNEILDAFKIKEQKFQEMRKSKRLIAKQSKQAIRNTQRKISKRAKRRREEEKQQDIDNDKKLLEYTKST